MTKSKSLLEIKSQICHEFRRFSMPKPDSNSPITFEEFYSKLESLHGLMEVPFLIFYHHPDDGFLPINNDFNLERALSLNRALLRVEVIRKEEYTGYEGETIKKRNVFGTTVHRSSLPPPSRRIQMCDDFRKVSSIIDVEIVPESYRRVKLMKNDAKPLGFYIRDGNSIRVTPNGIEKVPAIFISRLLSGGLAESTGLLAVNDEVVEVNGIEVSGKSLDQVTDMMVANSANLILTTKPVNQSTCLQSQRRSRASQLSYDSDTRSYYSDGGTTEVSAVRHVLRQQQPAPSRTSELEDLVTL